MEFMKKVLILHGWTYSKEKWGEFNNLLKEEGIEIIFPNVPGLTESLDKPWVLNDYVDWLKKIVDKEKDKIILIGHSNGGRIALAFGSLYPEKLEKLILIDSAGIYHNELPIRIKRFIFKYIANLGKKLLSFPTLKNILYKTMGESDYKNAPPILQKTMKSLIAVDLTKILDKISVPTLILWGAEDRITPLSDGKLMNRMIAGSKFCVIKSAKHSPQFTNAKETAEKILEFIKI